MFKAKAYLALVRPILEYSSTVWDPYLIKNINEIEKVQQGGWCQTMVGVVSGTDPGGSLGSRDLPLQKYIKEAKRVMYWYKNTLKCIIS